MDSRMSERGSDVGMAPVRYFGRPIRFPQVLVRSASLLAPVAARGQDGVYVPAPSVYDESALTGLTNLRRAWCSCHGSSGMWIYEPEFARAHGRGEGRRHA